MLLLFLVLTAIHVKPWLSQIAAWLSARQRYLLHSTHSHSCRFERKCLPSARQPFIEVHRLHHYMAKKKNRRTPALDDSSSLFSAFVLILIVSAIAGDWLSHKQRRIHSTQQQQPNLVQLPYRATVKDATGQQQSFFFGSTWWTATAWRKLGRTSKRAWQ